MARLSAEQLPKSLQQLRPVYLVTGDEPLLVQEACDAIRGEARKQGFSERELFHADPHFQWDQVLQSANSMSLFAEKKLLEVRLTQSKLNEKGSHAILEYCKSPAEDTLLLLIGPKLEKATQNSKWFKALDGCGVAVAIWPINSKQLPRWIEQRLQKSGLRADSQTIDILASRVEGNLLAAVQEIEKLKLVAGADGVIDRAIMASAVVNSARYDVFGLVDKALSGDARSAATTLNGLRSEGSEATIILWALTREVRTLISLKTAQQEGLPMEAVAKRHGVFERRLPLVKGALQRLNLPTLRLLIRECGYTDRTIKGMASGDPWGILLDIVLTLSGTRALNGAVLKALLKPQT